MQTALLPPQFFRRDPTCVARELIGTTLWRRSRRGITAGLIVETEAYLAEADPACHASRGRNRKNATMFGREGLAYVYVIHGRHCFNVVTEEVGRPSAILIRAVQPILGLATMAQRRNRTDLRDFCRGPARLCEAFDITRTQDGWDLTWGKRVWLTRQLPASSECERLPDVSAPLIGSSPRIGISAAEELPLRFFLKGSEFVSGPKWLNR